MDGSYSEKVFRTLEQINENIRVCSLSKELSDIRMWSHYASGHTGCAIKLDLNNEPDLFEVTYSSGLKTISESITENTKAIDILSFKTDHWVYEKEYRIISNNCYIPISGKITAIYLGIRVHDLHKQLILRSVPEGIPVYETMINGERVAIYPKQQID